jgi:uncharacterized protein with ParB-like and HNH nuclease domain
MAELVRGGEKTILEFIGGLDKAFIIPPFQRNYEWSEANCKELFFDIITSCDSGNPHYLGNIIYYIDTNNTDASFREFVLIDGQQRVTTILILLCALRDNIDNVVLKEKINKQYLKNDAEDEKYRVRLKQTAYDAAAFEALIENRFDDITPTSNVMKNYTTFCSLIKNCSNDAQKIFNSITKLEVVDVLLQVSNDLKAVQTIFEKINSTGKQLTAADLIRNLLLLTKSSKEQERLYTQYWLNIEKNLGSELISVFARDYLVMKTYSDVKEDEIYPQFKKFVSEKDNETILKELLRYSKKYAFIKFENCPAKPINKYLKIFNLLETKDVYPLYLYLFDKFDIENSKKSIESLENVFKTLSDFLIRYRIVKPSGGGGALRSVIQTLIEKIDGNDIEATPEKIQFELSNSSSESGRYPNDDEFKGVLLSNNALSYRYGRVLFMLLEETLYKNISVEWREVTIEHLMPQTLSNAWKKALGGNDEADRIYEAYLNHLGNLAPVSREYNSEMSNRIWDEKKLILKDIQFNSTSGVTVQFQDWNEKSIKERGEKLVDTLCKIISPPLQRTRPLNIKSKNEYEPGVYSLNDISTPMEGSDIVGVQYSDNEIIITLECSTWKYLIPTIATVLIKFDTNLFEKIVEQNKICKSTSKKNIGKDPIISKDKTLLNYPQNVSNTEYYCEGNISSNRARVYAKQLTGIFGCADKFYIEIE